MSDNDKTIASARKAARRLARATDASYQNCLDTIARKAGRAHWGAFLENPAPVTDAETHRPESAATAPADEQPVTDMAARADRLLGLIMGKAVLNDMDAMGLRRGSIQTWTIGGSSQPEHVPEGMGPYMHGAFTRMAKADIRQTGPFAFEYEGRSCVLVIGQRDSLVISLRGADLASRFGDLSPADRVDADGTMTIAPTRLDHRTRPNDRSNRSNHAPGILGSILTRIGVGRDQDPIRKAAKRRLIGIGAWRGNGPLLGTAADGRTLHMSESLPVLVAAPPGVGKTAGTVIPTILTSERQCLIVHDETDLWEMTSGTRAALGDVHVLRLDGRPSRGSLNPLHPLWVPVDPTARSTYLRSLAAAASSKDVEVAGRIHDAMVAEIATASNPTLAGVARRLRDLDPVGIRVLTAIKSGIGGLPVTQAHEIAWHDNVSERAFLALEPFLDAGVVGCTTDATIAPADLRGTGGGHGTDERSAWRPSTLYVVRGRTSGDGHGRVAAILQAAIWHHALTAGPNEIMPNGSVNGPLPLTVIIEGCGRLPMMPMLATALEMGRSAKVGHMIVGHTSRDVVRLLDERHRGAHESLFAIRIVHQQNDVVEAATIATRFPGLVATDILTMDHGHHIVSVQNIGDPLWMRSRFFFQDPELLAMTYNPRTRKGPNPVIAR